MPISAVLLLASVVLLFVPGPQVSIEFTGGTLMELQLPADKSREDLQQAIKTYAAKDRRFDTSTIAVTKNDTFFLRTITLTNEEHQVLLSSLEQTLKAKELQYTTIGPTVGQTLKRRAIYALLAACIAIIAYVALAFRKIPKSLNPWLFGVAAILALVHDILITVGIFTILSYTTTFQVDTLFITALLSIMGYSVSDTIVIFDRIRDNLGVMGQREDFAKVAELSLRQTMSRTLNTGMGALIMLLCLFFLGAESIRWFMLALIIGTIIGTYSSFFVATPLLVLWKNKMMSQKR